MKTDQRQQLEPSKTPLFLAEMKSPQVFGGFLV
jgi:hypothetical protein